jgi:hypothetical protein
LIIGQSFLGGCEVISIGSVVTIALVIVPPILLMASAVFSFFRGCTSLLR